METTCKFFPTTNRTERRVVPLVVATAVTGFLLHSGLSFAQNRLSGVTVSSGQYRTPVVELYTSEGCSSCPRADKWFSKLGATITQEFNAVPLAFHVDYWNYLGWKDPFSSARYTARQRELGAINGQNGIYTPEFLVSGEETRGSAAVVKAINKANSEPATTFIEMTLDTGTEDDVDLRLSVDIAQPGAELYLAIYQNNIVRQIGAGENRGRTLRHDFVVRHWQKLASLEQGRNDISHGFSLDADWPRENLGIAVVASDRHDGRTLQAVRQSLDFLVSAETPGRTGSD